MPGNSIRVVSDLTGIPMGTLRVWERRYGFPQPVRREDSNRRVYSAEDVERLRWIARALERGYRPGDVIEKSLSDVRALLGAQESRVLEARTTGETGPALVTTLLDRLARDDVPTLEAELRLAAGALGPRRFVTDLAHPLAIAVGEAWAAGKLAIRQEHLMTECLTTQLRLLLSAQQDVEGGPIAVLATLPTEPHTLGLQMAAVYLAVSGIKPRLLGANTPADEILAAVRALGASVVGITVTNEADSPATRKALKLLAYELPRRVSIWVGGSAGGKIEGVAEGIRAVSDWAAMDHAIAEIRQRSRRP